MKVVPKVQDSIARYELKDTGIPSNPFELDLLVLDLDTVFLPSPPSQEPIPIIRNEELLNSQPKFPSSPPLFIEPSLENELNDLDLYFYMPGERRKRTNEASKKSNKKAKIESNKTSGIFVGYAKLPSNIKQEQKKEKKIFTKKECIDEVASVEVLDNWNKKVLEMPVALNPETLIIFKESVNPKDFTYKNRLRRWLIKSPTIEV